MDVLMNLYPFLSGPFYRALYFANNDERERENFPQNWLFIIYQLLSRNILNDLLKDQFFKDLIRGRGENSPSPAN